GRGADLAGLPQAAITDLAAELVDFGETAAAIAALDLVITADTAVAHLAGALGRPVWVMLPLAADWRWLLGRDDSPWYPTMRLFRQDQPGNWPGVMHRLAAAMLERPVGAGFQLTSRKETLADHQVVQLQPQAEELHRRALAALTKDQWTEGEALLREVLRLQPERWGAHLNLGVALARQKKVAEAIACFQRYLAAVPNGVEGHNNLGLAHLEQGQLAD